MSIREELGTGEARTQILLPIQIQQVGAKEPNSNYFTSNGEVIRLESDVEAGVKQVQWHSYWLHR